ncbi:MAG: hypothetical protein ACKOA8_07490 [Deltaproteobacteria bacterium]
MRNDKYLVEFLHQLTKKDIFIAVWIIGAATFSYLMWSYQKKVTQRNFKPSDNSNTPSSKQVVQTQKSKKN